MDHKKFLCVSCGKEIQNRRRQTHCSDECKKKPPHFTKQAIARCEEIYHQIRAQFPGGNDA